jgi:BlaI family transcriptional regulator, penicillinase repressor
VESEQKLSRRERQIMDIVHRVGTATVREITDALPDPPTEDSIRAILRILERKRRILRKQSNGRLAYIPAETRDSARRSALRRVLDTFFEGSLDAAVATFLTDKEANLTEAELSRLAKRIRNARKDAT